jgi:hypothetical protein
VQVKILYFHPDLVGNQLRLDQTPKDWLFSTKTKMSLATKRAPRFTTRPARGGE